MKQLKYLKIVSGELAGPNAAVLRALLRVPELAYRAGISLRNFLYSGGWLTTHRVNVVVISVGNITTGGTGKTPLVIWLCRFLKDKGIHCAILTRGYKATRNSNLSRAGSRELRAQDFLDEPAILAQSCPGTEVFVNPDRVASAAEAIGMLAAEVLVMDDGFQHRRLHRDLDIVTVDATRPFGYGKIFPAGLLREPITALERADAVVITRCNQSSEFELVQIENELRLVNSDMIIARSVHIPVCVEYPEPFVIPAKAGIQKNSEIVDSCLRRNDSIEKLKNKKIFTFCGIGNPTAFLNTIQNLGTKIAGSEVFNDHHHYTQSDIENICRQAKHGGADLVLTTQKDWTKIANLDFTGSCIPLGYVLVELKFTSGEDKLIGLIEAALAGKIPHRQNAK